MVLMLMPTEKKIDLGNVFDQLNIRGHIEMCQSNEHVVLKMRDRSKELLNEGNERCSIDTLHVGAIHVDGQEMIANC